ncbi:unnamed protein product [Choristocarpus tenellus]
MLFLDLYLECICTTSLSDLRSPFPYLRVMFAYFFVFLALFSKNLVLSDHQAEPDIASSSLVTSSSSGDYIKDALPSRIVSEAKILDPAISISSDGLIFCPIAKVACAEWRRALRWMADVEDWETGNVHNVHKNGLTLLSNQTTEAIENAMNSNTWLKVVVVRDPVERILSGFLNKCLGRPDKKAKNEGLPGCPFMSWMPELFDGEPSATSRTSAKLKSLAKTDPQETFAHFVSAIQRIMDQEGKCKVCTL